MFTCVSLIEVNQIDPSFNSEKKRTGLLSFLCFSLLVFQVGLRWETGTDWLPYLNFFESVRTFNGSIFQIDDFEIGYVVLNKVVQFFTDEYSVFLLINALVFWFIIFKVYRYFTPHVVLSVFLFYALTVGVTGSNRQLLAVAIVMMGIVKLHEGRRNAFLIYIALAFLFHSTALISIVYLFLNRKISKSVLLSIILVSVLVGYSDIASKLFQLTGGLNTMLAEKAQVYSEIIDSAETSLVGLIKRVVLVLVFILASDKLAKQNAKYNLVLNGYIIGVAFYFFFKNVPILIARGLIYFNIMEPLLMVYLLSYVKKPARGFVVVFYAVMAIFYFYKSIEGYPDLFIPYKGIFINTDFYRRLY